MRWAIVVGLLSIILAIPGSTGAQGSEISVSEAEDFAEYVAERANHRGLTVDEYLAALRTQEQQAWVVKEVDAHPELFGGLYWDWEAATPGFVVQYVGQDAPDLDPSVREIRVKYSLSDLNNILDELDRQTDAVDPAELGLASIGIDIFSNAVDVAATIDNPAVRELVEPHADAANLSFREPFTPAVCNSRLDCTPYRGGIRVTAGKNCTYGLNARFTNSKAMVTAGHCDVQLNDFWTHNGLGIGPGDRNGLLEGREVDALRVRTTLAEAPFNRVYSTDGLKSLTIVGKLTNADLFINQDLRRAGTQTSTNCEVSSTQRTKYWMMVDGWLYAAWGRGTSCTAVGGDSGGPIWHTDSIGRRLLVGLTSTQEGIHALQADVVTALALIEWCTNSACT